MGDEVVVSGGSSKKKWIWIGVIGVVVVLLIVGGWMFFSDEGLNKELIEEKTQEIFNLEREGYGMYYRCIDYCPAVSRYNEKITSQGIERGISEDINYECLRECFDLNWEPLMDQMEEIIEVHNNSYFEEKYSELKGEWLQEDKSKEFDNRCIAEAMLGNKSCLKSYLSDYEFIQEEFKIPDYELVMINFSELICLENRIIAKAEITEGKVDGIQWRVLEEGHYGGIIKMADYSEEEIILNISSSEYPDKIVGGKITNPDGVAISYIRNVNEENPEGEITDAFSTRYC